MKLTPLNQQNLLQLLLVEPLAISFVCLVLPAVKFDWHWFQNVGYVHMVHWCECGKPFWIIFDFVLWLLFWWRHDHHLLGISPLDVLDFEDFVHGGWRSDLRSRLWDIDLLGFDLPWIQKSMSGLFWSVENFDPFLVWVDVNTFFSISLAFLLSLQKMGRNTRQISWRQDDKRTKFHCLLSMYRFLIKNFIKNDHTFIWNKFYNLQGFTKS